MTIPNINYEEVRFVHVHNQLDNVGLFQDYDLPLCQIAETTAPEQYQAIEDRLKESPYKEKLTQTTYQNHLDKIRLRTQVFPYDNNIASSETVPFLNGSVHNIPEFSPYSYIATQAPIDSDIDGTHKDTVGDFFRYILETNIPTIVTLVNPLEPKKMMKEIDGKQVEVVGMSDKCAPYWEYDQKDLGYGYSLQKGEIVEEKGTFDHTAESFEVIRLPITKDGKKVKDIVQIRYINWPDLGTPDPIVYEAFMKRVDAQLEIDRNTNTSPPLLAHCHAGSGRTGIFFADRMIRDYLKTQITKKPLENITLNIPKLVFHMKLNRETIHNNVRQYQFLLKVTQKHIEGLKQ